MGIYSRLNKILLKQACVLCGEQSSYCICGQCERDFKRGLARCRSCALPLNNTLDFCGECLVRAPSFDRAYALYDYESLVAELIQQFKYNSQLCIGYYFARQVFDFYRLQKLQYEAIIPMPLNRHRIQQRGYNQAMELLRLIAKQTQVIINTTHCIRQKPTQPMAQLSLSQRKKEIKGAFKVKPLPYENILLIDDVMTTGASLGELAKAIVKSSPRVKRCDILVLARAQFS